MLRLCYLALCLALASPSAINNKRQIGNAFEDYEHPALRPRSKMVMNSRVPMGPPKNIPLLSECKTKNSNEKCKQATPRGSTFLTNLEGTSLGPGFPPKPVGLLVKSNVSRELSSTSVPEDKFLVDNKPPMPPPPLKRRPLPKGRLRRPFLNSGERHGSSQEDAVPIILGPLFYEDLHNPESTSQAEGNNRGVSQENFNGSGERNRALLDSFNELDHPDPKLLSKFKGKLYPKYFAEKRNLEQKEKEELHRSNEEENVESNENSEEAKNSKEEDENPTKSVEEEEPVPEEESSAEETSEDYESSKEEESQDNSEEEHSSHHSAQEESKEEEEGPVSEPGNQESAEENEHPPKEHSVEEQKSEDSEEERAEDSEEERPEDSEEERPEDSEEEGSLPPDTPPPKEGLDRPTSVLHGSNGSSESNTPNSSNSREEDAPDSEESAKGAGQNTASGEAVHSAEESTEDTDYTDYSINNDIDSSAPSEEDTYHPSGEEEIREESNESSEKPASSSEDTNEIRPSSIESLEEVNEDYDSREEISQEKHSQESEEQHSQEQHSQEQHSQEDSEEQHSQGHSQEQQSEERPEEPPNEYDEEADEESPTDYYDMPDYDNASPESEEEAIFPKLEQEPTKKPQVYYKKRPATFYYIVGGSGGQKNDPKKESDDVENGSKPVDSEDNKIKQSEEADSSTPSAEEHPSSGSGESFGSMSFESFDLDSVLKKPKVQSDDKTTRSPVAVISITTPQAPTTKCDDDDGKKNEDPEDQKRLKTPVGTAKPNTLQPGDVVSITRARPVSFGLSPTTPTTTTFRPATISAIGIVKPDGSIIAKVVSPRLEVQSFTSPPPSKAQEDAQKDAGTRSTQVPWKTLLAAREATALTYLKPPPMGQQQTWFLGQARAPRFVDFLSRPL